MRLQLASFMSHDDTNIDLPETGIVQVTGPNGSGKSAIVEAIATCLWGKGLRGARWSPWRDERGWVSLMSGDIKIVRSWDGKAKKLAISKDGTDFDTTSKAQVVLDSMVGSFEVWRRTCVFSASDAAHFTMASDSERKELLENLLGLGWFDAALQACRRDLKASRDQLAQVERDRDVASSRLDGIRDSSGKAAEQLAELPSHPDIGLLRADIAKYDGMIRSARQELAAVESRRRELLQAGARDAERATSAIHRLDRLKDSKACYACGQSITDALKERMEREAQDAAEASEAARAKVAGDLRKASSDAEELQEELDGVLELSAGVRVKVSELDGLRKRREQVEQLVQAAQVEIDRLQVKVQLMETAAQAHSVDVAELEAAEQVLGVRGVRAQVVGRTLAGIEALANGWMVRLSSDIEIRLRPYTEKKSGGVVDAISLSLVGAGGDGSYLGASAGERRRVDVSLLLALAELAGGEPAGAAGWRSPIFLDEIFDSLDGDGRDAVVELVERLAQDRCVVLITHDESIGSRRADVRLHVDGGRLV